MVTKPAVMKHDCTIYPISAELSPQAEPIIPGTASKKVIPIRCCIANNSSSPIDIFSSIPTVKGDFSFSIFVISSYVSLIFSSLHLTLVLRCCRQCLS